MDRTGLQKCDERRDHERANESDRPPHEFLLGVEPLVPSFPTRAEGKLPVWHA
jgi:hypothetical protein